MLTKKAIPAVMGAVFIALVAGQPAGASNHRGSAADHDPERYYLAFPQMDAARGMKLFASKGCVACHAVNGVGGHDATALDAHTMERVMNAFDFVAKMWAMAPYMIAAQEEAMGGQIQFTGEEIADIIAFAHDDAQQHEFREDMIPPDVSGMMGHRHGRMPGHQEEIGHDEE